MQTPLDDKPNSEWTADEPVVLFDGVCGLCNRWVDFVMKRDRRVVFRFATLQSEVGQRILNQSKLPGDYIDSVVLVDRDGQWVKSAAGLRIFKRLGLPYSLMYGLKVIPRFMRDGVYDFIAKNRYRWFGRREVCRVPTAQERERFIA